VIGHILIGQNHLYVKMLFSRDSTIQKCFRGFYTVCKSKKLVPCQPSRRRVIPSGRSSIHSSSHPDDLSYRPDARQTKASSIRTTWISVRTLICIEKLLFQLASVRTIQQTVRTSLSDRASDFLSKSKYGKIVATVQTSFQKQIWEDCCNRPDDVDSRPDVLLLKASLQFKLNRPEVSLPWSGRVKS
jgi:hypothetical protein